MGAGATQPTRLLYLSPYLCRKRPFRPGVPLIVAPHQADPRLHELGFEAVTASTGCGPRASPFPPVVCRDRSVAPWSALVTTVVPGERLERLSTPIDAHADDAERAVAMGIIVGVPLLCFRFAFDQWALCHDPQHQPHPPRPPPQAEGRPTVEQTRYVLNWRDPRTGEREQRFFERQREAQERRSELLAAYERGVYSSRTKTVTVETAVATWLETKRGVVRPITFATYQFQSRYVVGPLATSEARRAIILSGVGAMPKARAIELLGREKVQELTTRRIRAWHKLLSDEVSIYCANKAMQILKAALALAAEDHEFRPPAMPTGLQRQRDKARKTVLTPDEVSRLLVAAREDLDKGVYVRLPVPRRHAAVRTARPDVGRRRLRGERHPRPAHSDARRLPVRVHQDRGRRRARSRCRRSCARCCSHGAFAARERMSSSIACSRRRASRGHGRCRARAAAAPLIYGNFRPRYWAPPLKRLGLPAVTPHSARHSFISVLQAQGVEVGLVAKLAGHKNAVVTLSHYTHAMRGGEDAVKALDRAYAGSAP